MDSSILLKIARLRTLAARQGQAFDVVRFAADRAFAKSVLTDLLATDDEELLVCGLEAMNALRMVDEPPVAAERPAAAPQAPDVVLPPVAAKPAAGRYIGRLR